MRIFAISDLHIDYKENRDWISGLSGQEYINDVLIVAGDICDKPKELIRTFITLRKKFRRVLFVPGNHDLWVTRTDCNDSVLSYENIINIAREHDIDTQPVTMGKLTIIPLLGWYDYTFGKPTPMLVSSWLDYTYCKWPGDFKDKDVTSYFLAINEQYLTIKNEKIISFSHFLPRIDLMPSFIPLKNRIVYPVLGSIHLEEQIRTINPFIHLYGHSHVNQHIVKEGIRYINNAYGYPYESWISDKQLICIYEI
jgi:Icc-related predicted phosphoesterase